MRLHIDWPAGAHEAAGGRTVDLGPMVSDWADQLEAIQEDTTDPFDIGILVSIIQQARAVASALGVGPVTP